MGCGDEKLSKSLTQTFTAHCNAMICQQVTLSGDAEWPKVADAVIEAELIQEVSVERKNLEEKDKTISGLLEHQRSRQLTSIQEEQFRNILLGAPKRFVMVESPIGDSEAFAFASQLQNLFRTAEWRAGGILGGTVFDPPVFGVVLQGSDDPSIAAVQQAFSAVDIPVEIKSGETSGLNEIKLFVGHKKYGVSQTPQEGPSNPCP